MMVPIDFDRRWAYKGPTGFMMVGLQGSGKTTSAGKLGGMLKKMGRHPLLVPCDVYRPAAAEQLHRVGGQVYNICDPLS